MGKTTGFLEFKRQDETYQAPESRIKNYKEFTIPLKESKLKDQGARCMDCGIPFCHSGCPLGNLIPDFNDKVYKGNGKKLLKYYILQIIFQSLLVDFVPAPCEAACTLNINSDPVGIKSIEHAIIDKAWENNWVLPQIAKKKLVRKLLSLEQDLLG